VDIKIAEKAPYKVQSVIALQAATPGMTKAAMNIAMSREKGWVISYFV
jgi:hypothetical protein